MNPRDMAAQANLFPDVPVRYRLWGGTAVRARSTHAPVVADRSRLRRSGTPRMECGRLPTNSEKQHHGTNGRSNPPQRERSAGQRLRVANQGRLSAAVVGIVIVLLLLTTTPPWNMLRLANPSQPDNYRRALTLSRLVDRSSSDPIRQRPTRRLRTEARPRRQDWLTRD